MLLSRPQERDKPFRVKPSSSRTIPSGQKGRKRQKAEQLRQYQHAKYRNSHRPPRDGLAAGHQCFNSRESRATEPAKLSQDQPQELQAIQTTEQAGSDPCPFYIGQKAKAHICHWPTSFGLSTQQLVRRGGAFEVTCLYGSCALTRLCRHGLSYCVHVLGKCSITSHSRQKMPTLSRNAARDRWRSHTCFLSFASALS